MKVTEAIIYSMTPEERKKPSIISPSRKRRIAAGSRSSSAGCESAVKTV